MSIPSLSVSGPPNWKLFLLPGFFLCRGFPSATGGEAAKWSAAATFSFCESSSCRIDRDAKSVTCKLSGGVSNCVSSSSMLARTNSVASSLAMIFESLGSFLCSSTIFCERLQSQGCPDPEVGEGLTLRAVPLPPVQNSVLPHCPCSPTLNGQARVVDKHFLNAFFSHSRSGKDLLKPPDLF